MYRNITYDECLICGQSLLIGFDFYRLLTRDTLCYKCRSKLDFKIQKSKFEDYDLYSFYTYTSEVSQLLIRYKDYHDITLGTVFLKPVYLFINQRFKDYEIVLIPSSEQMKKRRGFDHLEGLLKDVNLNTMSCFRKEDTVQRFSRDRKTVFHLIEDVSIENIIIFDDVITSGNSIRAALDLLKDKAKRIVIISVINNMK